MSEERGAGGCGWDKLVHLMMNLSANHWGEVHELIKILLDVLKIMINKRTQVTLKHVL